MVCDLSSRPTGVMEASSTVCGLVQVERRSHARFSVLIRRNFPAWDFWTKRRELLREACRA
jgi:hypothetical protein